MRNCKSYLPLLLFLVSICTQAQTRKDIASFSLFQHYFNPALTGYEGSMIKTYYRDQWSGFENAPRTLFLSGEFDLQSFKRSIPSTLKKNTKAEGARHAFGISYLHDTFGPIAEGQLYLSYGSRIQLTKTWSLRAGGAITYNLQRIDGTKITVDQQNDPSLQEFMNANTSSGRLDLNLGLILTSENFYAGYALQDAARGGPTTGNDYLQNNRSQQHIIQAGYRKSVSEHIGLITNALLRFDSNVGKTLEGQLKSVFYNTAWVGVGYRHNLAYSIHTGFRIKQLKIGFVRELATGEGKSIGNGTNEIILTYNLVALPYSKLGRKMTMW